MWETAKHVSLSSASWGYTTQSPVCVIMLRNRVERRSNSSLILFTLLDTFGKSHLMKTFLSVSIRRRINTRDLLSFVDSSGRRKIQKKGPTMMEKSKLVGFKPHGITVTQTHTLQKKPSTDHRFLCESEPLCSSLILPRRIAMVTHPSP